MAVSLPAFLSPQTPKLTSPPLSLSFSHSLHALKLPQKAHSFSPSLHSSFPIQNDSDLDHDPHVIGDCLVFEEGIFEDPYLDSNNNSYNNVVTGATISKSKKRTATEIKVENLVPEEWRELQAEINITKQQRRKIKQEMEFNTRLERKKRGLRPIRSLNMEEYEAFKEAKVAQLKPLIPENPVSFQEGEGEQEEEEVEDGNKMVSERVAPKNPRWAVYGRGLDDISEFFNSGDYEPGEKKTEGIIFSY